MSHLGWNSIFFSPIATKIGALLPSVMYSLPRYNSFLRRLHTQPFANYDSGIMEAEEFGWHVFEGALKVNLAESATW